MTPTLFFLPGSLCDARVWQAVYGSMRAHYPCINWRYPPDTSIAAMAARALAAASGPLLPVGLSMGGIVALEMQRQAPGRIAALALFGTNPGPDTPERRLARDSQLNLAERFGMEQLARERLAPAYLASGAGALEPFTSIVAAMAVEAGSETLASQSEALSGRVDSWPRLAEIDVPVLVAYGKEDRICPPDGHLRMASLLSQATSAAMDNTGHLAPLEQPELCAQVLREWLASIGVHAFQDA